MGEEEVSRLGGKKKVREEQEEEQVDVQEIDKEYERVGVKGTIQL